MTSKEYGQLYVYDSSNKNISYDTVKINLLKKELTDYIQNTLVDLDNEKIEKYFVSKRILASSIGFTPHS